MQSYNINTVCNICGYNRVKPVYEIDRQYIIDIVGKKISIPEFKVVKCISCGHMFISPVPDDSFLTDFYEHYPEPDTDFYKDQREQHYDNFEFARKMYNKCKKICTLIGDNSALLCDIGCGTGVFLDIARRYGFNTSGVDINPEMVKYAYHHFGVQVHHGTLEQIKFPNSSFDVITMWDVIEHIPNPANSIIEIKRVLKKDGLLAIETPDVDSLLHKLAFLCYYISLKKWTTPIKIYNVHHLHYFSVRTIKRFLENYGFQIITIEKDETLLNQWLGKDRSNWLKQNFIVAIAVRLIFYLARLLNMQNKIVVYARRI